MAFTPVIIGVADVKNKTDQHKEPAILMLEAIQNALDDTGAAESQLKPQIDSIDIVRTWTWPYADLPGLLSERLNLSTRPNWTRYTETHGGNQPAKLLDEAAGRIARGETTVAVVTGGEALASCEFLKPLPLSGLGRWPESVLLLVEFERMADRLVLLDESNCVCESWQRGTARLDEA